ncbi:DUF1566 domain-containing protein [Saccharospirillum mangrovi]|uniref:Lcl C-terminal domain-containing protein n=1 Tax=Saccharospirillum mangrovi TaxID=2161747 RepID=UPI000D37CEE6|nr:DUF1566 domain-containing protein [Saccharospirillum mangrovi]
MPFHEKLGRCLPALLMTVLLTACNPELEDGDSTPGGSTPGAAIPDCDDPDGSVPGDTVPGDGEEALIQLNDTGVNQCQDHRVLSDHSDNSYVCFTAGASETEDGIDHEGDLVPGGQDATIGRDSAALKGSLIKVGHGDAGFDFSKIGPDGNVLPLASADWDCVRDNHTGLMWETKTVVAGDIRSLGNTYSWYSSDATTNGGYVGTEIFGACVGIAGCDTEKYVSAINEAGLCSFHDWRMPSRAELLGIVNFGEVGPAIDETFFSHNGTGIYWSADTHASSIDNAWYLEFNRGSSYVAPKSQYYKIRLVRTVF